MSKKSMEKFVLHKYPYIYQCRNCKDSFEEPFELFEQEERQLKASFKVNSPLPLFFECECCHDFLVAPIGYSGSPSSLANFF